MHHRSGASGERRAQIIEAALNSFLRHGYNNTTMDDIVSASGLSKGTLYWYFDSKDDLFAAALTSVFEDVGQEVLTALANHETASDRLRDMARAASTLGQTFEGLFSLLMEFWASSSNREEAARIWASLLEEYRNIIVAIIKEGVESGEFKPVNAEALVWAMLATYDGLAAYLMLLPELDLQQTSEVFVETLLDGLQADNKAGS
jgi:AcrR family transcriptional regulator